MTNEYLSGFATTGNSSPVICKSIQPWKNHSHEDIIQDLMGCILGWWKHYYDKFGQPLSYSQADAISDAYANGILTAIEKDKKAPSCANKNITCEHCSHKFKSPSDLPGDERANYIYENFPSNRVPTHRKITIECPSCNNRNIIRIEKVIFSSLVFPHIRSAIQRGIAKSCSKNVSLEDYGADTIKSYEKNKKDEIPEEINNILREALQIMSERQRHVLAMFHGISGIYCETVEREIICPHCKRQYDNMSKKDQKIAKNNNTHPKPFIVSIDYSIPNNEIQCPNCKMNIVIDMSMNQTDIAKHLSVTKQRICSTINNVMNKLRGNVKENDRNYPIWRDIHNSLIEKMNKYEINDITS